MNAASAELPPARVSVVIPLYNTVRFIAEALESIRAQTLPVLEVVVVDDGSTDGGAQVAATFPFVRVFRQENSGVNDALNRGLREVTGDHLAFLDADDRWLPNKVAAQLAALAADPGLDLVFGQTRRFRTTGEGAERIDTPLDVMPGIGASGLLIKRASFDRVGPFTASGQGHSFLGWFARVQEAGLRSLTLPEILYERRLHDRNHGVLRRDFQRNTYLVALKAMLDRRRANPPPAENS